MATNQPDEPLAADKKDIKPAMSNTRFNEIITKCLQDRNEFERKIASWNHQRFATDRPLANNSPWANASNYRRKKSDEIIEQKKAFSAQIIHSSQIIANFKAMTPQNKQFACLAEAYYDYLVKELTNFDEQAIFSLDQGLESGFAFLKTVWDEDMQSLKFEWIDSLYMIFPSRSKKIDDVEFMVHVVQMTKDEALSKYGKIEGFKDMLKSAMRTEDSINENDLEDVDKERYERKGINMSGQNTFVAWEIHYKDPNDPLRKKRMRTMNPDDPKFDFEDDKAYPYTDSDGFQKYMFKQFRREWSTPDLYSSRGVPEIVWEEEAMLTALARLKHNYMAFVVNPAFTSENGLTTTSTNNISFGPGFVLPGDLQPIQFPAPPISMDQETQNVESIVDRRLNASNATGNGANTAYTGGENGKTARQVSFEASLQSLAVNYETMPWKKFLREVLRYGWERVIEAKPKSLSFYVGNTLQELPQEAMNGGYNIILSWSVDNINKEFNIQQATAMYQMLQGNPYVNMQKVTENLVNQMAPGDTEIMADPQELQMDKIERIAKEIDIMVSTGFPVRPKPEMDHYIAVGTTIQFIQNEQQRGVPIPPDRKYLLDRYIAAHREMLKKSNPEQYKQLNDQLNAMDIAQKQQRAQAMQQHAGNQQALQNQIMGAHAQSMQNQAPPNPESPIQPPQPAL